MVAQLNPAEEEVYHLKNIDTALLNNDFENNITYLEEVQQAQMNKLTTEANAEMTQQIQLEKFYNLSLKDLFSNAVNTLGLIFKDLLSMNFYSSNSFFAIFLKNDRALYLGFFLVFASMMLALFITIFYK